MAKYLDSVGALYIISKVKALLAEKVDKVSGKGLSTNDYTTTEKNKLAGIAESANNYSLPAATSSVLGGVKVGSNITNTSGVLSLSKANVTNALGYTPPTKDTTYSVATSATNGLLSSTDKSKLDSFGSASSYALKSDISSMYKYKGSVASASNLPTTGQTAGDVYNIEAASDYGSAGTNVAWTGSAWDSLGGLFNIESIPTTDIDTMFA